MEKRRTQSAYLHREKSPDGEINDRDLMGGNDYKQNLRDQERAQEQRMRFQQEKQAALKEKVAAYKTREQQTIEMFRQMAQNHKLARY